MHVVLGSREADETKRVVLYFVPNYCESYVDYINLSLTIAQTNNNNNNQTLRMIVLHSAFHNIPQAITFSFNIVQPMCSAEENEITIILIINCVTHMILIKQTSLAATSDSDSLKNSLYTLTNSLMYSRTIIPS